MKKLLLGITIPSSILLTVDFILFMIQWWGSHYGANYWFFTWPFYCVVGVVIIIVLILLLVGFIVISSKLINQKEKEDQEELVNSLSKNELEQLKKLSKKLK